jgi:type IV pilus assembly protein PilC
MYLFRAARRMEDLALFTRHVAGAMNSRVPLPVILRAYVRESEGSRLKNAISAMADRIEAGLSFSAAMEEHPGVFPAAYLRLVKLGEQGRALGGVMLRLAESMERNLRTYENLRRAAIYPVFVLLLLFGIVSFCTYMIVPRFQAIFNELGMGLPGPYASGSSVKVLLGAMNLALLFSILFLLSLAMGLRVRGLDLSRLQLQLPLIGPMMRQAESARFASYLGLLLENRIPLADALGLLADASENSYVQSAVQDFYERFQRGERLGDLLTAQPIFPSSMAAMISAAEDQGGLAETLKGLGNFYNDRTAHDLTVLRELYEPILLVVAGVFVAIVLYGTYMPLFDLPRHVGY